MCVLIELSWFDIQRPRLKAIRMPVVNGATVAMARMTSSATNANITLVENADEELRDGPPGKSGHLSMTRDCKRAYPTTCEELSTVPTRTTR